MKLLLFILLLFNSPGYELVKSLQDIYSPPKKDYVIIIDYTKSIDEDRLYLFDMKKKEIILTSKVSHAYNSGKKYATKFSNSFGTKKSCIGAFITLDSYYGQWGYSMRIEGLDEGINNNAKKRGIVFHSNIVQKTSWSEGCFATPPEVNKKLINLVKGGNLIYVLD